MTEWKCLNTGNFSTSDEFKLFNETAVFEDAKVNCENIGGNLSRISSLKEYLFVFELVIDTDVDFWIGKLSNLLVLSQKCFS